MPSTLVETALTSDALVSIFIASTESGSTIGFTLDPQSHNETKPVGLSTVARGKSLSSLDISRDPDRLKLSSFGANDSPQALCRLNRPSGCVISTPSCHIVATMKDCLEKLGETEEQEEEKRGISCGSRSSDSFRLLNRPLEDEEEVVEDGEDEGGESVILNKGRVDGLKASSNNGIARSPEDLAFRRSLSSLGVVNAFKLAVESEQLATTDFSLSADLTSLSSSSSISNIHDSTGLEVSLPSSPTILTRPSPLIPAPLVLTLPSRASLPDTPGSLITPVACSNDPIAFHLSTPTFTPTPTSTSTHLQTHTHMQIPGLCNLDNLSGLPTPVSSANTTPGMLPLLLSPLPLNTMSTSSCSNGNTIASMGVSTSCFLPTNGAVSPATSNIFSSFTCTTPITACLTGTASTVPFSLLSPGYLTTSSVVPPVCSGIGIDCHIEPTGLTVSMANESASTAATDGGFGLEPELTSLIPFCPPSSVAIDAAQTSAEQQNLQLLQIHSDPRLDEENINSKNSKHLQELQVVKLNSKMDIRVDEDGEEAKRIEEEDEVEGEEESSTTKCNFSESTPLPSVTGSCTATIRTKAQSENSPIPSQTRKKASWRNRFSR
ncbi:unnamed protein product [Protopolystoma xenopodis]|uniref:Uncharacterized protein n=1 Tax=Protopolystoma xenopodis TaxID=117903 RepID=A0A3S5B7N4_9PLAT|nr:unnamed protein product [Protopolystoma xenopodis]